MSDTKTTGLATTVSPSLVVKAAPPSQLAASSSNVIVPGQSYSLTVSSQDAFGNAAPSYTGKVAITTTLVVNGYLIPTPALFQSWLAGNAGLPATYQFTAADKGQHTFNVTAPNLDQFSIFLFSIANPGIITVHVQIIDTTGALAATSVNPYFNSVPSSNTSPGGTGSSVGSAGPLPPPVGSEPSVPATPADPITAPGTGTTTPTSSGDTTTTNPTTTSNRTRRLRDRDRSRGVRRLAVPDRAGAGRRRGWVERLDCQPRRRDEPHRSGRRLLRVARTPRDSSGSTRRQP